MENLQDGSVGRAVLYGLETFTMTENEAELKAAELKMLQYSLGVTRMGRTRNEYIRGTAQVERLENIYCERDKIEMVWTCIEERCRICREKGAVNEDARLEKRKVEEDVYGSEGGHASGRCDRE